ncbi:S49 family peptidase [Terasakiella sp.]|uniref:S49 family peptidase n=1 Tax=Terasakiella sp. TaxID=2034861 RepID=UPI003AA91173
MNGLEHSRLWGRLVNTPLMMTPEKARVILAVMSQIHGASGVINDGSASADISMFFPQSSDGMDRKVFDVSGPLAVVPIVGSLVHKNGLNPSSGMTGYDGITTKINAAVSDPNVEGILLDIDSPGGEVSGVFDLADVIREARSQKPVWAICNEVAASAAYALAAQATKIIVPRTGVVGSIGVVMMHADLSAKMSNDGISITFIYAGKHKIDGNSYEPLSDAVRSSQQKKIDSLQELNLSTVAAGRGGDIEHYRSLEAATFMGQAAVDVGLADAVMSPQQAVSAFLEELAGAGPLSIETTKGENAMKEKGEQPQATVDADAIRADATQQAGARIKAILEHEDAQGREDLARHLAFNTDQSAEAALALLAVSPKAVATTEKDPLGIAMAQESQVPDIGAGDEPGGDNAGAALLAAVKRRNSMKAGA